MVVDPFATETKGRYVVLLFQLLGKKGDPVQIVRRAVPLARVVTGTYILVVIWYM